MARPGRSSCTQGELNAGAGGGSAVPPKVKRRGAKAWSVVTLWVVGSGVAVYTRGCNPCLTGQSALLDIGSAKVARRA